MPRASAAERLYLSELQAAFRDLPVANIDSSPPSEAAWLGFVSELRERVLNGDPRQFLRWEVIIRNMFVDTADYTATELRYLKGLADWDARWRPGIRETRVGNPTPYLYHPASSRNLIHHAYHVAQFEHRTGVPVDGLELVFEFGGGYGSMCRLIHNLGFRGKYVIFDLPAFTALQRYFLRAAGLPVTTAAASEPQANGIACISSLRELQDLLEGSDATRKGMFIATWSLSEAPLRLRENVLALLGRFGSFLIAYQDTFREIDNKDYFESWRNSFANVEWQGWGIEHIPGNNYLVGTVTSAERTLESEPSWGSL